MFGFEKTDVKRFVILSVLVLWCATMIGVRVERTGSGYYRFLLGNLFLALMPLMFSSGLRIADRLKFHWTIRIAILGLWLLFLPNAPYILTDILHLPRANQAPAWYDLALLLSFAGTGLLMGYLSLIDVQSLVTKSYNMVLGWIVAIVSCVLSGFAIYLGRFLRWNSWDVIFSPTLVLDMFGLVRHPTSNVQPMSVTLIFGGILALGYVSLRLLLESGMTKKSSAPGSW